MKAVRLSRNLVAVIALVVSLGANVTLFVGGIIYSVVDQFVEQAFGLATAAGKQRKALTALKTSSAKQARALAASRALAARQRGELSTWRAAAARQSREVAKLKALSAKQQREISVLRASAAKQSRAFSDLKTASARQGRKLNNVRQVVTSAAERSRKRLVSSVRRSALTAPGKALPYAGTLVVAGLTVWEINDLCATIRDMDEIRRVAGESETKAESRPALCPVRVPSSEQLLAQIEGSAKKAWEDRKKYIPDLPIWEDIPPSWRDAWQSTVPDVLRGIRGDPRRLTP